MYIYISIHPNAALDRIKMRKHQLVKHCVGSNPWSFCSLEDFCSFLWPSWPWAPTQKATPKGGQFPATRRHDLVTYSTSLIDWPYDKSLRNDTSLIEVRNLEKHWMVFQSQFWSAEGPIRSSYAPFARSGTCFPWCTIQCMNETCGWHVVTTNKNNVLHFKRNTFHGKAKLFVLSLALAQNI